MATTDTRSGFRLPWSSDRNHDTTEADEAAPAAEGTVAEAAPEAPAGWPANDTKDSAAVAADADETRAPEAPTETPAPVAEEPAMLDLQPSPAQPAAAPRKPTKLMADLSAAIRATAETARDQALVQLEADAARVVEEIRAGSKEGEDALRAKSDGDIAGIKEWSRAEIARIKEETDRRIDARKLGLDEELAEHAAAIEQRVSVVETTVATYRTEMDAYAQRLGSEDDPARLATLAESMPEPPALESWSDLSDLAFDPEPLPGAEPAAGTAEAEVTAAIETEAAETAAAPAVEAEAAEAEAAAAVEAEAWVAGSDMEPAGTTGDDDDFPADIIAARLAGVAIAEPEAEAEVVAAIDPEPVADDGSTDTGGWEAGATRPAGDALPTADQPSSGGRGSRRGAWGEEESAWAPAATAVATAAAPSGDAVADAIAADDRGAIMAELEADAEAVVAEAAAETTDAGGSDPDAEAALSARLGAGGFEASFTDRLASLLPAAAEDAGGTVPQSTQVVVSGLVSVASIASFKRHLGRLAGVSAVAVASGPEGEFVFNVTHTADASFRDGIPTMPGFAARVTSATDGVVQVTARDPEAEG